MLMAEKGYTREIIRSPFGVYNSVWVTVGDTKYMKLTPLQIISFIASISTGLFMGIIRLTEPYFMFMLKKTFFTFYGIPYTEEEINKGKEKLTDTISAFLNSSLNIELVHIILKAISQECTEHDALKGVKVIQVGDTYFEEKRRHEISEIKVEDPKKWRLLDATVPKRKHFDFNILDNQVSDDNSLIINENIYVDELAPKIFAIIRREEGITNDMIRSSLSPESNRDMVFKAGEGQGKSGSFFFFSHDRMFIIKTMNEEEYSTFQGIFRKYYSHILTHKESLLARIYGVFTVKKEKIQPVHLILMGNTVKLHGKGENLKHMFDLKGSFVNRCVKMDKSYKPSAALKYTNLLELKKSDNILRFQEEDREQIMRTIK